MTETITVNAPARAWEGTELWTSFPPITEEYKKKGKGGYYRIELTADHAFGLLRHCEMAYWPDWEAESSEKEGLKAIASRILRAFGVTMNTRTFLTEVPSDRQAELILGCSFKEWVQR